MIKTITPLMIACFKLKSEKILSLIKSRHLVKKIYQYRWIPVKIPIIKNKKQQEKIMILMGNRYYFSLFLI